LFSEQSIVPCTKQLQIVGGVGAAVSPRLLVVNLKECASAAATAILGCEAAAVFIALSDLATNRVRDMGSCGRVTDLRRLFQVRGRRAAVPLRLAFSSAETSLFELQDQSVEP